MDIEPLVKEIHHEFNSMLDNEFIMEEIIKELLEKILQSKSIDEKNKMFIIDAIKNYYQEKEKKHYQEKDNKLLITIVLYRINNLNYYDYILIDHLLKQLFSIHDILTVILIDNLSDINAFCSKHKMSSSDCSTIVTLKKLSALWNLQHNF